MKKLSTKCVKRLWTSPIYPHFRGKTRYAYMQYKCICAIFCEFLPFSTALLGKNIKDKNAIVDNFSSKNLEETSGILSTNAFKTHVDGKGGLVKKLLFFGLIFAIFIFGKPFLDRENVTTYCPCFFVGGS